MGGCFGPTKEQLQKIRTTIYKNPKEFTERIENTDFVQKFGKIRGEVMKRIPKEWKGACKKEPLTVNKQFYFVGEEAPTLINSNLLLQQIIEYWQAMRPTNSYLLKAIQ